MRAFMLFVWVMLAVSTGYTLFHITFQVEALETELSELNRQIVKEQEAVHVLEAEWAYLNRPERIEKLSETLLPMLQRVDPAQVMHLDSIPRRTPEGDPLPPVGARTTEPNGAEALPASLNTSEGE